jgi:hypothetical protein
LGIDSFFSKANPRALSDLNLFFQEIEAFSLGSFNDERIESSKHKLREILQGSLGPIGLNLGLEEGRAAEEMHRLLQEKHALAVRDFLSDSFSIEPVRGSESGRGVGAEKPEDKPAEKSDDKAADNAEFLPVVPDVFEGVLVASFLGLEPDSMPKEDESLPFLGVLKAAKEKTAKGPDGTRGFAQKRQGL